MNVSKKHIIEIVLAIAAAYTLSQFFTNHSLDVEQRLQMMAIAAVLLSLAMMGVLSMRYVFAVARTYFPIQEQKYALRQQAEQRMTQNSATVFEQLQQKIAQHESWKLLEAKPERGYLKYRTKLRRQSWGEVITVKVEALDETDSYVRIVSVPLNQQQREDKGNNRHNVHRIEYLLRQVAQQE